MFSPGYLQTDQNTTGWIWFAILLVLFLLLIIWWSNRRRGEQTTVVTSTPAQAREDMPADDLVRIEGIGPKVARVLNEAGITTFDALAHSNPADVQKVLNSAGLQMMNPEGWIEQARLAAKGDWDGVQRLQNELKGGRKK